MSEKLTLLPPGTISIGTRNKGAGGWLSNGQRPVANARKRLGYSQAAESSSVYTTPSSRYSFYSANRQLMPEQYWSLYKTSPDVRSCVDSITRRIATWDWYVKPTIDARDKEEYKRLSVEAERVANFFRVPNSNQYTWQEVMTRMVTDLLIYDAGVLELVDNAEGDLTELVSWLGSEWFPNVDKRGMLLGYDQDPENSAEPPVEVGPDKIAFFKLFPNNRSVMGLPLIESCLTECITVLLSSEHAMLALDADEIPPGLLVLGGVAGQAAERARADLQAMRGKDHRVRVITSPEPSGIEAKWVELRHTPKDLEMLQVVRRMRHAIWRVFGVMPVELGEMAGVPRAAAEVQMDVSSSHLISPILEMIQSRINAAILPKLLSEEDRGKILFAFERGQQLTPQQRLWEAERSEILLRRGVVTINEIRSEMGYLPLDGGDVATLETALGPMSIEDIAIGLSPANTLPEEDMGTEHSDPEDQLAPVRSIEHKGHECTHTTPCVHTRALKKYSHINFTPTKGVLAELKRGLKWHEEGHSGDGLVAATVTWATRMVNGEDISPEKARKMRAWLARHEVDKEGEGFYPGQDGFPSPGRVAWALWGGDPAVGWSKKLVSQMDKADEGNRSANKVGGIWSRDEAENYSEVREQMLGLHISCRKDDIFQRAARTYMPSDWQSPSRFDGYRTIDLSALADDVASYTREAAGIYAEAADECAAILSAALGPDGEMNVAEAAEAQRKIEEVLLAVIAKWAMAGKPYYDRASKLGLEAAERILDAAPNIEARAIAEQYVQDAMLYLEDERGLVGTLRSEARNIVSSASNVGNRNASQALLALAVLFAANAHRVTNWTGKLVGLSNITLVQGMRSVVPFATNQLGDQEVTTWWYEWVTAGGRSCPICVDEGANGFRKLTSLSRYPGEDTYCGANCRCVLVFWKEKEVNLGVAVLLGIAATQISKQD